MIKKMAKSNTMWSLGSNGLTALLGFVNIAMVARQYDNGDKVQAGQWFLLLTVYTMLEMLRTGWVQTPLVRYFVVAETKEERSRLIAAAWQILLLITAILAICFIPVSLFMKGDNNNAFYLAKKMTPWWLISALPYQYMQWQLQATSQFKKLAISRLFQPVLFTILLVVEKYNPFNILQLAVYYSIIMAACGLSGFFFKWLHWGSWKLASGADRKKLSHYGKFSMLTMITSSLLRSSDQFIIGSMLGSGMVALYAVPQKLIEVIEIPVRSFASVAVPQSTSLWQQGKLIELRKFFYRQTGLLTLIIAPILAVLIIIPSPVVKLLGGDKYSGASLILQLFCLYAATIPLDRYCGVLLDASARPAKNLMKVIVMLAANIAGDFAAIWLGFGVYGVAASSLITFLVGVFIGWVQLKDILGAFSAKSFWNDGIKPNIAALTRK
jgi:O-antigen/teichoic acid export membrane protein